MGDDLVWASLDPGRIQDDDDENWTSAAEEESDMRVFTRPVFNSRDEAWTAIGYDEETGRVALGRRDGCITFLRL